MPQDSLFEADRPVVGLRITATDHSPYGEANIGISIEVRNLDGEWATLSHLVLIGHGRDFLASAVEDVVHAWHYEDARAIVREVQRNDREARHHHQRHSRSGA